ncbi:MAG: hypothetical protein ABIB98_02420 [bacterium]
MSASAEFKDLIKIFPDALGADAYLDALHTAKESQSNLHPLAVHGIALLATVMKFSLPFAAKDADGYYGKPTRFSTLAAAAIDLGIDIGLGFLASRGHFVEAVILKYVTNITFASTHRTRLI